MLAYSNKCGVTVDVSLMKSGNNGTRRNKKLKVEEKTNNFSKQFLKRFFKTINFKVLKNKSDQLNSLKKLCTNS